MKRGKKVIVLVHCILNQNSRFYPDAKHKGAVVEIIDFLVKKDFGILQIPCIEFLFMGLDRSKHRNGHSGLSGIWHALNLPEGRKICREIAEDIAIQLRQYIDNGFYVAAVLGKNTSPTCGVALHSIANNEIVAGPGVFIQELQKIFKEKSLDIPFIGINAEDEPEEVLNWLKINLK